MKQSHDRNIQAVCVNKSAKHKLEQWTTNAGKLHV